MVSFFLAPALVQLRSECDAKYPNRDKSSDGWIGDPSHAARVSDHNPCWSCTGRYQGIVRALDVDISPDRRMDADIRRDILKATVGDHRVWYVISNGIIYSRTFDFEARKYLGSNGHFAHVHVSLRHGFGEFDTSLWFDREKTAPPRRIDASVVRGEFKKYLDLERGNVQFRHAVRNLQAALNREYPNDKVKVDGWVGAELVNAWGRHEAKQGGQGRPRVPDNESLSNLVRGHPRFKVIQ